MLSHIEVIIDQSYQLIYESLREQQSLRKYSDPLWNFASFSNHGTNYQWFTALFRENTNFWAEGLNSYVFTISLFQPNCRQGLTMRYPAYTVLWTYTITLNLYNHVLGDWHWNRGCTNIWSLVFRPPTSKATLQIAWKVVGANGRR